ncbi:MAG: putative metalloprotease CJM1_0395 family protein [Gammaproteobacteria bacterium]
MIGHVHTASTAFRSVAPPVRQEPPEEAQAQPGDDTTTPEATLSEADQKRLRELKERDREVRAHEQAHLAAAGSLAQGGATYTYERGPDQRLYAIGGEVQIDTSQVKGDPAATLRKAQIIRRAALAPNNPSAQDRAVAAQAAQMASEAAAELASADSEENALSSSPGGLGESDQKPSEIDQDQSPESAKSGCPACGGAHSAAAHEGMTSYAAMLGPTSDSPANQISAMT